MSRAPLAVFEALQRAVAAASTAVERQALVERWLAAAPPSPLIGADEALIWYAGPARKVVLRGDMLQERSLPLTRLADTPLWFYRARYEPDARLDYHLLVDGRDVGDPRNPRQAPSGYGPRAELRMPRYQEPGWWIERPDTPRGQIIDVGAVASRAYGTTHHVRVYLPAAARAPLASIYFGDGGDYLRFGSAATTLDNLIAAGAIPPCLGVFIDPSAEHGRAHDYDCNPRYAAFVCHELVPWIDAHYPTQRRAERRAIVGASFSGLIALWIAHQRPDIFGLVASQSGYVSRAGDALIDRYHHKPTPAPAVHLLVGSYETHLGPFPPGHPEGDFVRANRALRDVLRAQSYRSAYAEYHDGHAWALWRARLGEALIFLLG
ncbi:alpha/beta hydrolase [Kallotenue papyrolyticum]|uniref:alpha/beta hydrolase n=1 Tax=Kallotenue papyrolyticum TaxID=1325125 RepID=UPI0004927744|nr:esterase family protein [Kallotenue papyrolyticum]